MLTDNNTPFAAIGFEQWHRDGGTMAVCSVRGTYEVSPSGALRLASAQDLVLADEFDGDPQKGPLVKPNDLVPYKPGTDVTFLGSAFAPHGQAAPLFNASIQIMDHWKTVRLSGPREWVAEETDGWRLSRPEPVKAAPICYTKASGGRMIGDPDGTVDPRNPIGCNLIHSDFTPTGRNYPAAQIDSEDHPIGDWHDKPPLPQGFGPMSPWWQARQRFAGTYDDDWKEHVHPRLPADFDYQFYNCAHPDLAFTGFLKGGDRIELINLSPNGRMAVGLPEMTPFARFSFTDGREVTAALNLDGAHFDFRKSPLTLCVTWRTWIEICPAFFRIDLEYAPSNDVSDMDLPYAGEHGLQQA